MKAKNNEIIEIVVDEKEDFYNQFNLHKLSSELGKYIYEQETGIPLKSNISIHIKTRFDLTAKEKNEIMDMIREYFGLNIQEMLNYEKYNSVRKVVLFILGIILIFISRMASQVSDYVIPEVFLIVGWVAICEVFENILFIQPQDRFKLLRYRKLVKCKIIFEQELE